MTLAGFPHSGTPGSTPTCGSPRLFAACRALLRLSVPRHPPCALVRLTGYARTLARSVDIPGPPILLSDHYAGARVFLLDALLDQLPNTQVFNATRSGGVLAQNARLVRTFFSEECTRRSRKEVIQPQVPLRLPCYDFAPVTELAFGGSLPCGLGHRLRALPTPMA